MKKEEAKEILSRPFNMKNVPQDILEAHRMAIEALEQEPILDKARSEIEQGYCTVNNDYDRGRNYGLYMATQIIDKYKEESEDKG